LAQSAQDNYKEIVVNQNEVFAVVDTESRASKTRSKKRKWREIEAIQDRFRLQKELAEYEVEFDYDLDNLSR
jgi:hypothetical protein